MLGVTVNDFTTVAQTNPKIVGLSNGNFVVAWQGTGSGDAAGVFATGIGVKAAHTRVSSGAPGKVQILNRLS